MINFPSNNPPFSDNTLPNKALMLDEIKIPILTSPKGAVGL